MTITAHIINAFTKNSRGGNPAAVILDESKLSSAQRQDIARKIGVSETVFLDDFQRADFYTPTRPIANCGHATIAAFSLVNEETGYSMGGFDMVTSHAPDKRQYIVIDGKKVFLDIPVSKSTEWKNYPIEDESKIYKALNLRAGNREESLPMYIGDMGNRFILVPLRSKKILQAINPNRKELMSLSEKFNVVGFYPFTLETDSAAHDAQARMFAPAYGINEEPATGMAGAALAYYLKDVRGLQQDKILIEQGRSRYNFSPSLLEARIHKGWFGQTKSIQIGGQTKEIEKRELTL